MYSYLTVTTGDWSGRAFLLDPGGENRIGRSTDCAIQLVDPLCSRVHAILVQDEKHWWVRDRNSRNGTFVNGRAIREAMVRERDLVRVGSTEFAFHQSPEPPAEAPAPATPRQTIVQEVKVEAAPLGMADPSELPDSDRVRDLLLLYQLSIRLVGTASASQGVRAALDLLKGRTRATLTAFLHVVDGQTSGPPIVADDDSNGLEISAAFSNLAAVERRAVWTASRRAAPGKAAVRAIDALCVPAVHQGQVLGVFHVYREQENFQQAHFDFAISVANITAMVLARADGKAEAPPPAAQPDFVPLLGGATPAPGLAPLGDDLRIEFWERRLIAAALERSGGNVPAAAKLLGIGRATLYRKIEDYDIER